MSKLLSIMNILISDKYSDKIAKCIR